MVETAKKMAAGQRPPDRRAASEPAGPDFTIITGLSGAGRSEAARCLEDLGYFVVDNLPPTLIEHRDMRARAVQVDPDPGTIRHQGLLRPGLQIAPNGLAPRAPERREARSFMASSSGR